MRRGEDTLTIPGYPEVYGGEGKGIDFTRQSYIPGGELRGRTTPSALRDRSRKHAQIADQRAKRHGEGSEGAQRSAGHASGLKRQARELERSRSRFRFMVKARGLIAKLIKGKDGVTRTHYVKKHGK